MELKRITPEGIPSALELAERYRLLNESEQAESICQDVLDIDPKNQLATRIMLLAISDQFGRHKSATLQHAQQLASQLSDPYEKQYFSGVLMERWARAKWHEHQNINLVHDWLHRAMDAFSKAQEIRPAGNDAALLRWNTCVRLLKNLPKPQEVHEAHFGD
ncbi:MAG TPA: hypothetical protein VGL56_02310 [Fimbriimonadaceae bacterium]|jgi:hypothetical protein